MRGKMPRRKAGPSVARMPTARLCVDRAASSVSGLDAGAGGHVHAGLPTKQATTCPEAWLSVRWPTQAGNCALSRRAT